MSKQDDLVAQAEGDMAEARQLAATFNESTGLSWLWAFLFGPIYFWVHGFVGMVDGEAPVSGSGARKLDFRVRKDWEMCLVSMSKGLRSQGAVG